MADIAFVAELPAWQKFLIALVMVVILVVAVMVSVSTNLGLAVLGLFVQMAGVLLLSLGLVKTNDDLLRIANHPKEKDLQAIITDLASERFTIMLALFLFVLGLLLQILDVLF